MTNSLKVVNIVIVFNPSETEVLMCYRTKDPYKGLYNFLGGKKENNESNTESAYRELFEESGITSADIELTALFTTQYHRDGIELQVFFGTLKHAVDLVPEKHPLHWITIADQDFADNTKFAGQGNIKHMVEMLVNSQQGKGL